MDKAVDDYQSMNFEFPDENIMLVIDCEEPGPDEGLKKGSRWTMVFDRASNALGNVIGVVIISPQGFHMPFTSRLCFECTNNMAEYEVCIMGIKGEWDTKHLNLIPYREHVLTLISYFEEITFEHFPQE